MQFDPTLLNRWRELAAQWLDEDLAEADPVKASILRLVTNGLWASETFGLYPMDVQQRAAVVERLLAMTRF